MERVEALCDALAQGKADNILVLRLAEITVLTDYLMICSGATRVQVRAIAERLGERARGMGLRVLNLEGHEEGLWIVADLGDIMVHIYEDQTREFYALERLWGDAPQFAFES